MLNNLFTYATKELSQDAFICWLLSFAHKDFKRDDLSLRNCAVKLIQEFVPDLKETRDSEIYVTFLKPQFRSIDVFVIANEEYGIIIEDKTFSKEHGDQLTRYTKEIEKEYPKLKLHKVYYKTGFQSNYEQVKDAGYQVFDRKQILNIFTPFVSEIENNIFIDYFNALKYIEEESNSFKVKKIADWSWAQVNGFYDSLKRSDFFTNHGFLANYGYVPNARGGFYAMWIYNENYHEYRNVKYELYLQMEFASSDKNSEMNICLKTSIQNKDVGIRPKELRNFLVYYINESENWVNALVAHNFRKPNRFGSGKTMTLGIYDSKHTDCEELTRNLIDALEHFNDFTSEVASRS